MLLAETAAMPFRMPEVPCNGLVTTLQLDPFQCSMSGAKVAEGPTPLVSSPTAQTLFAEMATTPFSVLLASPGPELLTTLQVLPFQCSIRVWILLVLAAEPTAQTL